MTNPKSHMSTMRIEIGLTGPIATEVGRRGPSSANDTRRITKIASMIGSSTEDMEESGVVLLDVASRSTSTSVCIAIPPRRFPVAMPRLPLTAAEAVIAISGRVPATPSRISPPSASPRLKRSSTTSVLSDRNTPATHVAADATRKIAISSTVPRSLTRDSEPRDRDSHPSRRSAAECQVRHVDRPLRRA